MRCVCVCIHTHQGDLQSYQYNMSGEGAHGKQDKYNNTNSLYT
ncbi:hypothetical protein HanXRQr2_Chr17g0820241 [Helianthus annuus]|uniref:Uncharacterized protein n=1 Tax=Helianthus annuus TaxID=4232 RepID=A0A9K3DLL4_HELAN|nr:hypothetical protein HanXRQr2_Chr17g0820241 [Helianthus annuus]